MLTYQDYLKVPDNDNERMQFVKRVINEHKATPLYRNAVLADEYMRHENRTIKQFQKFLYSMTGQAIPDNFSANYKMASNFFKRFVTQENQYLLGNGVTWQNDATGEKLGENFDNQLQKAGKWALSGAVSYGFFNLDHLDVFAVTEYAPLVDEENAAMMAGVRFWQVDPKKPLRATFYEIDGYTDYIWNTRDDIEGKILVPKRPYILKTKSSEADGTEIYAGLNYPSFPIVPLWGNPEHVSQIVGLQEQIDCYDLIKSGYADNVDEGSLIYWTLQNAGGMSDVDLAKFLQQLRTMHAAKTDDDVTAESHNVEAPYQSREALLAKLRADLYEDAMALDTKNIADGAVTATQIKAAYEPLNSKTDEYEYCVREFIKGILKVADIEDEPTFTRSAIVNSQEEIQLVLQSGQYLTEDYITRKVLTLLGDGDLAEDILKQVDADELKRFSGEISNDKDEDEETAEEKENIEE